MRRHPQAIHAAPEYVAGDGLQHDDRGYSRHVAAHRDVRDHRSFYIATSASFLVVQAEAKSAIAKVLDGRQTRRTNIGSQWAFGHWTVRHTQLHSATPPKSASLPSPKQSEKHESARLNSSRQKFVRPRTLYVATGTFAPSEVARAA